MYKLLIPYLFISGLLTFFTLVYSSFYVGLLISLHWFTHLFTIVNTSLCTFTLLFTLVHLFLYAVLFISSVYSFLTADLHKLFYLLLDLIYSFRCSLTHLTCSDLLKLLIFGSIITHSSCTDIFTFDLKILSSKYFSTRNNLLHKTSSQCIIGLYIFSLKMKFHSNFFFHRILFAAKDPAAKLIFDLKIIFSCQVIAMLGEITRFFLRLCYVLIMSVICVT